jgi:hypothetical protein
MEVFVRRLLASSFFVLGLAAGCKESKPASPSPAPATTAAARSAAPPAPTGKLTPAECKKLYEHVMSVAMTSAMKEEKDLTPEQRKLALAEIRKELASDPELKKEYQGCESDFTRARYSCIMRASTEDAMDKCDD